MQHKFIKKLLTILIVLSTMSILFPTADTYAAVKMNVSSKTLYVGNSTTLNVSGTKKKITWSTSNKKIATVTSKGKVTAKKKGGCTITAKVGKKKYTCKVTVKNKTLTINKSSVTIVVGKSTTITAKTTPSATVKWSTSNSKIATVSSKGKITGKKKGTCYVYAKGNGITKKITVKVTASSTSSTTTTVKISKDKVVCINPGHQNKGDSSTELNGPNSTVKKAKVTTGATGVSSKISESSINLAVGLKLKTELENRGYTVIMTRTTQDVNISNKQRAEIGNKASVCISLHCDSSTNSSAVGAHTICIDKSSSLYDTSYKLGLNVINSYCTATGINSKGVVARSDLTGLNWSTVPAIYIEMGFLSNPNEDLLISSDSFQNTMAFGIANGIDAYFNA